MEKISDQGRLRPWMGFVLFGILMAVFLVICTPLQLKLGILGLVLTELIFGFLAVLYCLVTKVKIREVFPIRKFSIKDILGCIFLLIGVFPLAVVFSALTATIFPWSQQEAAEISTMLYSGMSYPMCILIVCVLPAVCEEAIHRGAILSNFRSLRHDWVIVLIMSIFFGINHCSVLRFLSTAVLGAALSYVMVKKNNIILTMFMHFANNLVSATAGFFSSSVLEESSQAPDIASFLGIYLILAFASPVFIVLGMMLLNGTAHKKIRFLYAGILSAVMLICGIALAASQFSQNMILQSTIGYEVTEEAPDCSTLSFDIEDETSATFVAILTEAEGDYTIRIDGDKGSNIINAPVPEGNMRMITYDLELQPDHYTITVVGGDNAVGEQPNLQIMIN